MSEKKARTVLGDVSPAELGFTSMHEHITFQGDVLARRLNSGMPDTGLPLRADDTLCLENIGMIQKNSILCWDAMRQDDEDVMVGEVEDFMRTGGKTIVEVSAPGIQLDTEMIRRIAKRSGAHVIVSTGFYTWDSWPERFRNLTIADYRAHMKNEIEHGVQGTDILPGSIKIALEDLNQMEEHALRAAAQLSAETGIPLTIHPCNKAGGQRIEVIDILKEEGADLGKIVMAHTNVEERPRSFRELIYAPELYRVDTTMARRMLDTGVNLSFEFCNPLGFETMGRFRIGDMGHMAGLWALINDGYAGQIVLGNDVCGRNMLRRGGALGYMRLTTFVIPTLKTYGSVSDYAIRRMTVDNPARILAF